MRWPFTRKEAEAAAAQPQLPSLPPRRTDWAALPAIQRSVGPAPLTMQPSFGAVLASNPPAPALQPLGHHVSPQAAPGLVLALAAPQQSSRESPAMVHRPRVQRKAAAAETEPTEPESEPEMEAATVEAASESPVPVQPMAIQRLSQAEASPMVQPVA